MVPGSLSAANRVRKGFNAVDNASDAVRAMDNLGDATRSLDNLSDARRATPLRRVAGNLCHSFAALTLVLMADGSAQRIDQVEVGDRVAAVEVTSGDVVSAEVSVLHRNFDSDLVDVEVVDGEGVRSVVSTTSRHLWWSVDRGGWVEAADLVAGERLWSADGGRVEVVDARWVGGSEWMYDLTVDGVHTFQVLAGDSSVLVHNSNADECLNPGAAGAVSMDEAVARGADHVGGEGRMIESGSGGYQFTHVASQQAWYAAVNALLAPFWSFKVDYRVIPWATFTDPEVARVGLSETEARAQGIEVEVTRYNLDDLDASPIAQLQRWLHDAETHGAIEPTAMALATVGEDLQPHVRMVLLRYLEDDHLIFFTNYDSAKGKELAWNGGKHRLAPISSYLDERMRFWNRWIGALTRLDRPTHVLWGRRDPIAVPAIAEALASEIPDVTLTWLDELGHYPMLESPARWAEAVLAFAPGRR